MAHIKTLIIRCQRCMHHAQVELYSTHNESHGKFCARCGTRALKELTAIEQREYKQRTTGIQDGETLCEHGSNRPLECEECTRTAIRNRYYTGSKP
jgi:hypothetical protein